MAVFFESAKLAHIVGMKMARFTADARLPTVDTPALIVRTRLADYIDTSRNWENSEYWAQGLGFKVARVISRRTLRRIFSPVKSLLPAL